MKFGLLMKLHNDPNRRRSFPMLWQNKNPIEMELEVHPAVEESLGLIAQHFPQTSHQFPLAVFDESHGGDYSGLVFVYEHKTPEPADKIEEGNLPISRLEARVSFAGKKDEREVVKHRDLSRLHLSVYAQRSFAPKNSRRVLKGIQDANGIRELVNISYRWGDNKTFGPLGFEEQWDKNTYEGGDGVHIFKFHPIRSTYLASVPINQEGDLGERHNPVFPFSQSVLPCDSFERDYHSQFVSFLRHTFGDIGGIPLIGGSKIEKDLPNFPREPCEVRGNYFPKIEKVPQYLFGQVLPYLKKFTEFQE